GRRTRRGRIGGAGGAGHGRRPRPRSWGSRRSGAPRAGRCGLCLQTRASNSAMTGIGRLGRLVLIGLPSVWLALFFLLPLLIVLKISLAESVVGIPPYTPLLSDDGSGLRWHATLANFALLAGDDLYLRAYLGSLGIAALATVLCLLLGYRM